MHGRRSGGVILYGTIQPPREKIWQGSQEMKMKSLSPNPNSPSRVPDWTPAVVLRLVAESFGGLGLS